VVVAEAVEAEEVEEEAVVVVAVVVVEEEEEEEAVEANKLSQCQPTLQEMA
jgi:hypothetical protein